MKYFDKTSIQNLNRVYRLNLINSISGYKAANLIGTKGPASENLSIISSVVHLGSNPALLGFIMRPSSVERHTLQNIKSEGIYTINSIHEEFIENAHYTSAKFDKEVSEFDACQLEAEYRDDFTAPFVKNSQLKMGMKLEEIVDIKINGTYMIIGSVEHLLIADKLLLENGRLDLNASQTVCISGLNTYHKVTKIQDFPYARVEELPTFNS